MVVVLLTKFSSFYAPQKYILAILRNELISRNKAELLLPEGWTGNTTFQIHISNCHNNGLKSKHQRLIHSENAQYDMHGCIY